eukprot:514828-Pleurochrysis_carterae.AAC.1
MPRRVAASSDAAAVSLREHAPLSSSKRCCAAAAAAAAASAASYLRFRSKNSSFSRRTRARRCAGTRRPMAPANVRAPAA